jgi:hypothetical protein
MSLSLILWGVVLAAALILEGVGLLSGRDKWYTATDLIKRWVPKVIIAVAILWLAHHFGV